MPDTLKTIVSFTGVAIGGTATLAHGLSVNGQALKPDHVELQFPIGFELVSATTTDLTIRNVGNAGGSCRVLVEAWHPVERSFGTSPDDGSFQLHLTPQPFAADAAGDTGAATPVVVLRPGGVATENVVTTWADAVAKLGQLQGPRILQFDDSISSPIVIPAGTYDMTQVIWSGGNGALIPAITVSDGAVFTKLRSFDRVAVSFTGVTPPVSDFNFGAAGNTDTVYLDNQAQISSDGFAAFFLVSATGLPGATFILGRATAFLVPGGAVVVELAAANVHVNIRGEGAGAILSNDAVSGPPGSFLTITFDDPAVSLSTQQTTFSGTQSLDNLTQLYRLPTAIVTSDPAPDDAGQLIRVNPTGGAFAVTLPPAIDHPGQSISIKNVSTSANNVTLTAAPGDTVEGGATSVISGSHFFVQVTSDGVTSWWITGR